MMKPRKADPSGLGADGRPVNGMRGRRSLIDPKGFEVLAKNSGTWFIVWEEPRDPQARRHDVSSLVTRINRGLVKAISHLGKFEAVSRYEDGVARLYARHVKEDTP